MVKYSRNIRHIESALVFFALFCGLIIPTRSPASSARENAAFKKIESFYLSGSMQEAQNEINAFTRDFPDGSLMPSVENIRGLIFLKNKEPVNAAVAFKKALDPQASQAKYNEYILYNLATAYFQAGNISEAETALARIRPGLLDQETRAKYAVLTSKINQLKVPTLSSPTAITHPNSNPTPTPSPVVLGPSLPVVVPPPTLEPSQPIAPSLPMVDLSKAAALNSQTVGILLPTTGKVSRFGTRSLQAIQLAFDLYGKTEKDNSKLTLVVEDSGESPEEAIRALDKLVIKHGVIAVIGPMLTKGIDQISQRAQQLGVPLISLARKTSTPGLDSVFQGGLIQKIQTQEIARNAIQKLGVKRFAIVYPNEKFGMDLSEKFWDAVESYGGKVVDIESYNPLQTDFRTVVDKLSGLFYQEARQADLDQLAADREANHVTKQTRKTAQFYHLKPQVDYEAVFIADDPSTAGLIIPTFAYRDVDSIKFLGMSSWDSQDFITRTQGYNENAYLVDAFFQKGLSGVGRKFFSTYRDSFNQDPSSLEAVAYDAGLILKTILSNSSNLSRSELKDKLRSVRNLPGVTGSLSYDDGTFTRPLKLLNVKSGQFVEVK